MERQIERHQQRRDTVEGELLSVTDASEARRLQEERTELAGKLSELEDEWLVIQEEMEGA